jgi:hypothetical protein
MSDVTTTQDLWEWYPQGDADEFYLVTRGKQWVISFRLNGEIATPEQIKIMNFIVDAVNEKKTREGKPDGREMDRKS